MFEVLPWCVVHQQIDTVPLDPFSHAVKRIPPVVCACITVALAVPLEAPQHQFNVSPPQCSGMLSASTHAAAALFRRRSPMQHGTAEGGVTGANGRCARKPVGQGSPVRSNTAGMFVLLLALQTTLCSQRLGRVSRVGTRQLRTQGLELYSAIHSQPKP